MQHLIATALLVFLSGCARNHKAMKFLQCEMTIKTTSGKQLDDLLLNALDGRMTHG